MIKEDDKCLSPFQLIAGKLRGFNDWHFGQFGTFLKHEPECFDPKKLSSITVGKVLRLEYLRLSIQLRRA